MTRPIVIFFILLSGWSYSRAQVKDTINRFDKEGLKQGTWVRKDDRGRKVYTGRFKDDLPVGKFTYYYPTGNVKSITTFYPGVNEAFTVFYNEEGQKVSMGKVTGDKKDSTWVFFDSNDSIASVENYRKGKKEGVFRSYYTNRRLLEEKNYSNDELEGPAKEYFDNGKIRVDVNYRHGLHNGKARFYFLSGQLNVEGDYLNDFKEGTWNFYEENGTLDWQVVFRKSSTVQSLRYNGSEELYYPDKLPRSKTLYKNGLKNGPFTEYYDLGKVEVTAIPEKDGYPEEHKETVTGQKVKRKGDYLNGKLDGKVTLYKEDGTIDREETYKEGELVK